MKQTNKKTPKQHKANLEANVQQRGLNYGLQIGQPTEKPLQSLTKKDGIKILIIY